MTDTERIDLDELDVGGSEDDAEQPNRGDWLWREDGSAESADPSDEAAASTGGTTADTAAESNPDASEDAEAAGAAESTGTSIQDGAIPHVPRQNQDKPVGIPVEQGGAGAGPESDDGEQTESAGQPTDSAESADQPTEPRPMSSADYHDADVDDMTMAITFNAVRQLAAPSRSLTEARRWTDWIGIVGDVPAHRINKFQREHQIDADFFNGTGTDPGDRLASIDRNSMFFAERLVVVGVEGEDEWIAETAGWEFVPLSTAADNAGWELD